MEKGQRLIDANDVYALFDVSGTARLHVGDIDIIPRVDAVEVVRCKDCKHYDNSEGIYWCHLNSRFYPGGIDWHSFPEEGYCSYGERKDK